VEVVVWFAERRRRVEGVEGVKGAEGW